MFELAIADLTLPMPYMLFFRSSEHIPSIEREFRAPIRRRLASASG